MTRTFPAHRIELHEAWSSAEHARTQAQLYPASCAGSIPVGGGVAVFCGKKSPLSEVYGLGISRPVTPAELDEIERFYRRHEMGVCVRLCPLADASLQRLLEERGYTAGDAMNVYARSVEAVDEKSPSLPGIEAGIATPEQARRWYESQNAAGDWAEPDGVTFMVIRSALKAGTQLFLAWHEGQPVSGGALEIHDGVASLMAADTLPAFRQRGLHSLLVNARLAAAREAGCDMAVVHTSLGAPSEGNVQRAGFELAYTVQTMVSPTQ
jgi:GNAT superfamily N-acetyltransferase